MKKIIGIMLLIVLSMFVFCGCGSNAEVDNETTSAEESYALTPDEILQLANECYDDELGTWEYDEESDSYDFVASPYLMDALIEAYDNNDTDYWWTVSSSFRDLSKTINGTIRIINGYNINKTLYAVDNGEVIYDFMYDE